MLVRFDGKRVIVAGAARSIGRAITRAFAADGAEVLACDRLVGEVEAGDRISATEVDVAGGILGLQPKPIEDVQPEEFAGIVDANLKGCFLFARVVAPGAPGFMATSPRHLSCVRSCVLDHRPDSAGDRITARLKPEEIIMPDSHVPQLEP